MPLTVSLSSKSMKYNTFVIGCGFPGQYIVYVPCCHCVVGQCDLSLLAGRPALYCLVLLSTVLANIGNTVLAVYHYQYWLLYLLISFRCWIIGTVHKLYILRCTRPPQSQSGRSHFLSPKSSLCCVQKW